MSEFLKNEIEKIKGQTYIVDIPIEEFDNIEELNQFVRLAKKEKCGAVLHHEVSNYHQGVVVQLFDKETCEIKEFLDR